MINAEQHTEQSLLDKLKAGKQEAFTELYQKYHRAIYAYLLDFVKSPQLAEDLVHEVFMKIWEIREKLHITASFSSYLYRISHNKAIDALKRIAADDVLRKEMLNWLDPHLLYADTAGDRVKHYEEMYETAIATLSPQRQKVFVLCREEGKTYDEAAAELGISRNTVKEHMVYANRFLRSYFMEQGVLAIMILLLEINF